MRYLLLFATAALSILNGMSFSPLFDSVAYFLYLFTRGSRFIGPDLLVYLTSAFVSSMTLLLAGIPAAAYERIRDFKESTPVSLGLWLVATAILTLPTLMRLVGED
jgi:hypothetical protein